MHLLDLPHELLALIAARLSFVDLPAFASAGSGTRVVTNSSTHWHFRFVACFGEPTGVDRPLPGQSWRVAFQRQQLCRRRRQAVSEPESDNQRPRRQHPLLHLDPVQITLARLTGGARPQSELPPAPVDSLLLSMTANPATTTTMTTTPAVSATPTTDSLDARVFRRRQRVASRRAQHVAAGGRPLADDRLTAELERKRAELLDERRRMRAEAASAPSCGQPPAGAI